MYCGTLQTSVETASTVLEEFIVLNLLTQNHVSLATIRVHLKATELLLPYHTFQIAGIVFGSFW